MQQIRRWRRFPQIGPFAPGGGTASSRGWRSHRDRNPRISDQLCPAPDGAEELAPLRESWFTPPICCGIGALAGRRRTFRLIKMQSTISAVWLNRRVLMVAPILPPEGARRVAGGGDRIAIGTPGSQTSYDPPRMGRRSINAPMEGLCRCNPCGRFGPGGSCAPPGLDHRSGFLGVLVATLPPT